VELKQKGRLLSDGLNPLHGNNLNAVYYEILYGYVGENTYDFLLLNKKHGGKNEC
jgi:hypothetical protein